jgi:MFS transporter, FSR family, fosmidomycin resistance protein
MNPRQITYLPIHWAFLNVVNNWVAGYLLAHYTLTSSPQQGFFALIVYVLLGYGGQLPVGLWLNKNKNLYVLGILSIFILTLAIQFSFMHLLTGIVISGIASAGIHVTSGSISLLLNKHKITPLGIFMAPGIAGLVAGGFCGSLPLMWIYVPLILIAFLTTLVIKEGFPQYSIQDKKNEPGLATHDWIILTILLLVCLLSFLFNFPVSFSAGYSNSLLIIGLSIITGELTGCFITEKIGWRKWVYITLPLSLLLLQFGRESMTAFALGAALLQGSVPVTVLLMRSSIPKFPTATSAFSLGTVTAFAALLFYVSPYLDEQITVSPLLYLGCAVVITITIMSALAFSGTRKFKA